MKSIIQISSSNFLLTLLILGVTIFPHAANSNGNDTEINQSLSPSTQTSKVSTGDSVNSLLMPRNIKGWWNGTNSSGRRSSGSWQLVANPNLATGLLGGYMTFEGQNSACPSEKIPVQLSVEGNSYLLKGEGCGTTFEGKLEPGGKDAKLGGVFDVTITGLKW